MWPWALWRWLAGAECLSATGRESCPGPVQQAREVGRLREVGLQSSLGPGRRVDARVAAQFFLHEFRGLRVGVRVVDEIGVAGRDVGTQQVVDEQVRIAGMFRVR